MDTNTIFSFVFFGLGIWLWILAYLAHRDIKKIPATRRQVTDATWSGVTSLVYYIFGIAMMLISLHLVGAI